MKAITYFIFIILFSNAHAFSGQSLTWQKVALEEKIQRKLANSISTVLKDNQYLIEVDAEISDPGQPNLGNNKNKSGPKISEIEMSQSSGDYIAFSKVGLEVPVLEKYFDEDKNKLMNLYRFNEAYDLFKNLDAIKVNVWLSDKINPQLLEIAKKVINNTKLSLNGITPSIKIDVMEMEYVPTEVKKPEVKKLPKEKSKAEQEPKIWAKDWYEWASRWGNAVGLIFASLIIAFALFSLFKQYKALMDQMAKKEVPENNKDKEPLAGAAGENPTHPDQETTEDKENALDLINGFIRFKEYLIRHPESAINLIREWLSLNEESCKSAIRAISQQADSKEIEFIMSQITQAQKNKWKSTLSKHLIPKELAEANKFIFSEIVRSQLVPSDIHDGELLNLIVDLTPKSTVEFLQSYEAHVPIMMNIIAPSVLAKVFEQINLETTSKWLTLGSSFKEDMIANLSPLKKDLKTFSTSSEGPFIKKILELIPKSKFDKEESLYKALAKSISASKLEEVAQSFIPSEVIDQLPASAVKEILNTFPMEKKIEIIVSQTEMEQSKTIEAISAAGSTARELIEMEIKNLKSDRMKFDQVSSRQDELKQEYINTARLIISSNSSLKSITNHLIESWIKKLQPHLKVASQKAA